MSVSIAYQITGPTRQYGQSCAHVESGVKILKELRGKQSEERTSELPSLIPIESLLAIFTRLDTQLSQLYVGRAHVLSYQSALLPVVPHVFKSLDEARNSLDSLMNAMSHLMHDMSTYGMLGEGKTAEIHRLVASVKFAHWARSLENFIAYAGDEMSERDRQAAYMLKIHYFIGLKVVELVDVQDEMAWDVYQENFAKIVYFAESVAEYLSASSSRVLPSDAKASTSEARRVSQPPGKKTFSMDQGIVGPLFEVVYKCRHPIIRRKALAVLKAYPRQESSWDSTMVALVAERLIELEEEAVAARSRNGEEVQLKSCDDIPRWARISQIDLNFPLEGKKAFLTYSRPRSPSDPTLVRIEEIVEF